MQTARRIDETIRAFGRDLSEIDFKGSAGVDKLEALGCSRSCRGIITGLKVSSLTIWQWRSLAWVLDFPERGLSKLSVELGEPHNFCKDQCPKQPPTSLARIMKYNIP